LLISNISINLCFVFIRRRWRLSSNDAYGWWCSITNGDWKKSSWF
jgi:hypothetical protein